MYNCNWYTYVSIHLSLVAVQLSKLHVFDVLHTLYIAGVYVCTVIYMPSPAQWFGLCGEQKNDFGSGSLELGVVALSCEDFTAALHECVYFFQEPVSSLMQYAHEGKCVAAFGFAPFQCTTCHICMCLIA